MKRNLSPLLRRLQQRIVVWISLTIVLYILDQLNVLAFIRYVLWASAAYTCLLTIIWVSLALYQLRKNRP